MLVESAGIHLPQTLYRASWNEGPNKQAIIDFVSATTEEGHPMLELLDYLRANQFKVFIVFGGEIFFLRVFAEEVYKIPPE
ncbi:MAG: hypothetical protein EX260_01420 [Desulfobulbaceae bacterium]|nr:MAG: hypothetical protein EX260_01420 [Desulfobulbaceae bacterium]